MQAVQLTLFDRQKKSQSALASATIYIRGSRKIKLKKYNQSVVFLI